MGKETIFLKLDKPDPDEFYNIGVYNKNLDKIDAELERQNTYIKELERKLTGNIIYGFHINGEESDPDKMVSYIADAVGMTPAYMDFEKDTFNYGSWKDAFFMPRPCMLKYDGTVDYYLDENDYTKRADGGDSDVENVSYAGNAMMEWGKDGRLIWIKVVPDQNPISGSVYIANYQADDDYHAWSFENASGTLSKHFYTAIYKTCVETTMKRSRSMSPVSLIQHVNETAKNNITYAKNNNIDEKEIWFTEVFADLMLEEFLLILMSKTNDLKNAYGKVPGGAKNGRTNSKGLFYGKISNEDNDCGTKVFGMENFWETRRYLGYVLDYGSQKIKMTYSDVDGQTGGYSIDGENYIDIGVPLKVSGNAIYIKTMQFNEYGMFPKVLSVNSNIEDKYYCSTAKTDYSMVAGAYRGPNGANDIIFIYPANGEGGLSRLSCKPY